MSQAAKSRAGGGAGPEGRPELPKSYRPADHEGRIRNRWEASGAFHADPARVLSGEAERGGYCILIPPPNVTDRLHLGHALNNTLQDVLVRAHRMMGFEALWMPGTDHAGIATQAVVERRLRKEGKLKGPLKEAMKREEFVAQVQAFKDEYEATITGQLKAMGCSCDWARQRFTMDEVCARAVQEAFFRLFRDGLIYRGKRLVNWDPALQTAVADDETEDIEIDGQMYYLRYPLVHAHGAATTRELARGKGAPEDAVPVTWSELRSRGWPAAIDAEHADEKQAWVTVATTRPETYLGDTAVAVNPRDPRARALRGLAVELPLVGRIIPIIEDDYVVMPAAMQEDPEAAKSDPKAAIATGFLKVTPAHDSNDYEIGMRHKLPLINVLGPDATISDKHGWTDVRDARVFVGKSREEARKLVIREFQDRTVGGDPGAVQLFARSVPYRHSVPHSDRSKAAIEPYLSDQWYVRVTDERMRGAALAAMNAQQRTGQGPARSGGATPGDSELTFYPARYAKTFETWHENIRDWCISRQLWWGHRIPVWSKDVDQAEIDRLSRILPSIIPDDDTAPTTVRELFRVTRHSAEVVQFDPATGTGAAFVCLGPDGDSFAPALEREGFRRDPDVLDTWFSSGLWPMSTMGWPDPARAGAEFGGLLEAFNPSSALATAREIITLWVSRMTMFNRYFMPGGWARNRDLAADGRGNGPVPFHDVFIHAMIQDGEGRKMSKSLGNGVDPLDIIATHGTDAMRYTLVKMTTQTQDVRMPVVKDAATGKNTSPKFDEARNFCNKLWQVATGFAPAKLGQPSADEVARPVRELRLIDRWMLSRLESAVREVNGAIKGYEFSDYAEAVYRLLWWDFCDWYVEGIKPTVGTDGMQRAVLAHALETIVRLLHPIAPFITEAVWERLRDVETLAVPGVRLGESRKGGLLATAGWPEIDPSLRDEAAEADFEQVRTLVAAIREVRARLNVPPKRKVTLHCTAAIEGICRKAGGLVETLGVVDAITTGSPAGPAAAFPVGSATCHLSNLADAVDAGAERTRLEKVIADNEKSIKTLEGRLANPGYSEKAPPAMVQQTRDQLAKAKAERDAAVEAMRRLS